jgi:hypothetical protein
MIIIITIIIKMLIVIVIITIIIIIIIIINGIKLMFTVMIKVATLIELILSFLA